MRKSHIRQINIGTKFRFVAALALALSLSACNFSSGGINDARQNAGAPAADAGADQDVLENSIVELSGTGAGDDAPLILSWSQLSGDPVTIIGTGTVRPSFEAPNISPGTTSTIVLQLKITDAGGRSDTDEVTITVNDQPPVADAGDDHEVPENTTVLLSGFGDGSDAPLFFDWIQISGTPVTVLNADAETARFVAPDVQLNTPEVLIFAFIVTDAEDRSVSDEVSITVVEQQTTVSISGTLEYELPVPNVACDGLDFSVPILRPIRGATVELVDSASNAVVDSTVSNETGQYAFLAESQLSLFVRVRAELKSAGQPSWDVEVRDNTSATGLPLDQRPLYVLDGPASTPTGANEVRDLVAGTGWTGTGFGQARSAAPFAVLDSIYSSMQLILGEDPQAVFAALDAYWSVNNSTAVGDINFGEIGTSFYQLGAGALFLLGKEGDDIEEFDSHVISHEWAHYFEDSFSRTDSIAGPHGQNDRLDPRVAFSEGFATAMSGMALSDPMYCDAFWFQGVLRGFEISIESQATGVADAGWYNESSVMKVLYDLWDTDNDGADTGSIGFGPIFDVMTGTQVNNDALTTVFSFMEGLRSAGTGQNPLVDALLQEELINPIDLDKWGSTETNDAGAAQTLPLYESIAVDGASAKICTSSQFDGLGLDGTGNKLNEHKFLQLQIVSDQRYSFSVQADPETLALLPPDDLNDPYDQSDPDLLFFLSGQVQNQDIGGAVEGLSVENNVESFTSQNTITPGTYVLDVTDFRWTDTNTSPSYPVQTCFDISVTSAP